ncbi:MULTISPECIES: hypothetical protein [Sanguibacteroides]|uniref:hypothetical protein n=1 Tax=Sanguibacteroides TaxID=1635148 RepID=UPI000D9BD1B8|nr:MULTISPECIES: hypothetical protein [Sanguibacteroides]PXZ42711.1 hypothetical protein DMB45_14120 [Sanguibacteroides justesenii]
MKNKLFFILIIFLGIPGISPAQNFEPGEQAQGYLNMKNVSVDYATGTFHYSIPLYTLRSGDFLLPVSLDYNAKGVKIDDKPGQTGYNWTLNTGGIVTRVVRGGIADEDDLGYARAESEADAVVVENDIDRVNKRQRDGESDIFTAVFSGNKVNFMIKMDANNRIHAVPLERTNIHIECSTSIAGKFINGWTITDEGGNRYYFYYSELIKNMNSEAAISSNGIRNKMYLSSWYLTRIEPLNGEPITFNYSGRVETEYISPYRTSYWYGRPVIERSLNFSSYQNQFRYAIEQAKRYLGSYSSETQLNSQFLVYAGYGNWIINPYFEENQQIITTNLRIMGMLGDIQRVTAASQNLINTLNNLINSYKNSSSSNARAAASWFQTAKRYVIESIDEMAPVTLKESGGITSYKIASPLLTEIKCVDKKIMFTYKEQMAKLNTITLSDITGNQISKVKLYQGNVLTSLYFYDKNDVSIEKMLFDYYPLPTEGRPYYDLWGYRKRLVGNDNPYSQKVDIEAAKAYSLKTITLKNGGRLSIDYESNVAEYKQEPSSGTIVVDIGGIRVKSLTFMDRTGEKTDSVLYAYPRPGRMVYDSYERLNLVHYEEFTDWVKHSRIRSTGFAFLNTGNNGVYYPYVKETTPGKGIKTFLFHVPSLYFFWPEAPLIYPFWLNGLPLATAEYDDRGNLKRLVEKKYYTDLSFNPGFISPYFYDNMSYFTQGDTSLCYKQKRVQVKPYEYYLDREEQIAYFQGLGTILLYQDEGRLCYYIPYDHTFIPNIEPRTRITLPQQNYELYYGGKTLLKELSEYRFEVQVTDSASFNDFTTWASGTPFQKTEFFYDNPRASGLPTRISRKDSRGNTIVKVTSRVTEMSESASPFISKMKQANLLSPVIKQATLRNGQLIDETVVRYETLETDSSCFFGLTDQYIYQTENPVAYTLAIPDQNLFTRGENNYRTENSSEYKRIKKFYLPVSNTTRSTSSANVYDASGNYIVLKAHNASPDLVAAIDRNRHTQAAFLKEQVDINTRVRDLCDKFIKGYNVFPKINYGPDYMAYTQTYEHGLMIDIISVVASGTAPVNPQQFQVWLDSARANDNTHAISFMLSYFLVANEPSFDMDINSLQFMIGAICNPEIVNLKFFDKLTPFDPEQIFPAENTISITSVPNTKRVKLFVLVEGPETSLTYSVRHAGGTSNGTLTLSGSSGYSVQSFEIDLTPYAGVISVTATIPSNVVSIVMVPRESSFEAISYNLDGSIFCKFDHNGQLELNEYDEAGRLIRIKDRTGNTMKELQYNRLK